MTEHSMGVLLHVEDDTDVRESTAAALSLAGFDVRSADSASAAVTLARELKDTLDVLIVDYHLGEGTSGTEVAEWIGRQAGYTVPTIMVTGDTANAEIPLLSNAPVWLMRKPISFDVLIAALPSLVSFRRAVRKFFP